jgi:uncharacterized membrane protein
MKKLLNYFLKGLLIFVPIAVTVFIIVWTFQSLDTLFRRLLGINIAGLGLAVTAVLILLIGFIASGVIGKKIFQTIEKIFSKLPLVKLLYNSIKDLVEAFAGEKKRFDKPVVVNLAPNGTAKLVGFVTKENLQNLGLSDYAAVYLPQSYNFAGNLLLVPKESIQPLHIDSSDAMAFVVSGGIAGK